MEVVQMWECKILDGQTIIPFFYDISPYNVKHQAGDFETSFDQHEKDRVNAKIIEQWKDVLRKIGGLKGFNREAINGGLESQLVKEVFGRVMQVLKKDDQIVTDKLVGIDLHVREMMRKLGVVHNDGQMLKVCGKDVRVVAICGIPGSGKTTLAKVVFNKMHNLFDGCSFLEGINSERVEASQERLIASLQKIKLERLNSCSDGIKKMESLFRKMKVLIVLDGVREVEQIEKLAGKLAWFGPGSRIIVTTDRKNVLKGFVGGAVEEYVGRMRDHHALLLFRQYAFQGKPPADVHEFDSLSIDIVKAIGLHPKAIILQASFLSQKRNDIDTWRYTLHFLRRRPPEGVATLFNDSYKSLDPDRQKIFLDIACFFVGEDKRIPTYMWKASDCYPPSGMNPLCNLHWLEDGENNELRMDNLIRDFGRDIVKNKVAHKRCRFWNHSDALSVLENSTVSFQSL
ncbi:hypothetical protein ACJRO7_015372 [Eucalyptus globulus]|uniref:Uncharacterized protein n=1 Tax=Eucalyptus globulus TaxID=34317 RepID=A0ABD3L3U3_EUCGL